MTTPAPKTIHILSRPGDRADFVREVHDRLAPGLLDASSGPLKIGVTDEPKPRLSVIPTRAENLLMVSTYGDDSDRVAELLAEEQGTLAGYRVEESRPVDYTRSWADGVRTRGVVLLTLLRQNPRLSWDDFMYEWHGRHTPKAMRIHPLWSYTRNVVTDLAVEGSRRFDGIVEEVYARRSQVTNPVRMFGGPLRFPLGMLEVGRHAPQFLDLGLTENYLLGEWHLRG